jgi:uncharacterized protein (TIGR01777 family)
VAGSHPIVLTGATGLVGGALLPRLVHDGHEVRALSRSAREIEGATVLRWDGVVPPEGSLDGAHAVVHLAGEPLFSGPLTASRRQRVWSSRVDSARAIARAIGALPEGRRPRVLVCASAVGYYGDRGEEVLDETSPPGDGFLADLCVDWEEAAAGAEAHGVRVVSLRIGIVLSRHGGALSMMARPFRLGLGGKLGDGRQWVPWVHLDDLVALAAGVLADERFQGPVNAVGPAPVRNEDLTRALGRVLGRPTLFAVPAFVLRLALGELSGELLGSKRVEPRRARERGFAFGHADLEATLVEEL